MSNFAKAKFILECASSHEENGDHAGADALRFAARKGKRAACLVYPAYIPAIENAFDYAAQEMGA